MEGMYVKAHVGAKLKQWIEDSYQDGIVSPPSGSVLLMLISVCRKQNFFLKNKSPLNQTT